MSSQTVRWKAAAFLVVVLAACVLALPTFFGDDPALQIVREDRAPVESSVLQSIRSSLDEARIETLGVSLTGDAALVRFADVDAQLRARDLLRKAITPGHAVALTFAPRTPSWLAAVGLKPVSLGLDLRGGVYFLYEVDLDAAIRPLLENFQADLRARLRDARLRVAPRVEGDRLVLHVVDRAEEAAVEHHLRRLQQDANEVLGLGFGAGESIEITSTREGGVAVFTATLSEAAIKARQDIAIEQNVLTLRNRVNELGVAEPLVQRQGLNRIVVELPGVQDPAQAARLLGVTATLQFRLVDTENAVLADKRSVLGSTVYYERDGAPILLRNEIIVSGDQLTAATAGYSRGQPAVFVRLDAPGAARMLETTQKNLGRRMAVLFVTQKPELVEREGEQVFVTKTEEVVVSAPVIQGVFGSQFQVTGLTPYEAQDLALLLRAGSLAAPIAQVAERTIGPSLGQDNIAKGRVAIVVAFLSVVAFMAAYYRLFGMVANLALLANVILIIAVLALLRASLTLPGIAGIVLTVGMAVDANVLIFERIREELRAGNSPRASIAAGYDKAFSTIADANVTTLIAALVLFVFGTGPVKGFAVTLSVGIMTSMYTAVVGTRAVIGLLYGGRRIKRLSIGGSLPRPVPS